jgi:hypothetical protein
MEKGKQYLLNKSEISEFLASYADVFINYLIDNKGAEQGHNSAIIILYQLIDPAYYKFLLNPLPSVYSGAPEGVKVLFGGHDGTNEIGLFALFTQSGFFIALLYLFFYLNMRDCI